MSTLNLLRSMRSALTTAKFSPMMAAMAYPELQKDSKFHLIEEEADGVFYIQNHLVLTRSDRNIDELASAIASRLDVAVIEPEGKPAAAFKEVTDMAIEDARKTKLANTSKQE